MNISELTSAQRSQRMNIRNGYMVESVETIRNGMERQDDHGKACLQEMIDACEKHGVDNHGETPAFP